MIFEKDNNKGSLFGEGETLKLHGGEYRIEELIGKGGMGEVYKAYDPLLKRRTALKFLWHENPENMKRFIREAQAQAKVKHENICKVYQVGETGGKTYIAMQYIDGQSLDKAARDMTVEQKLKVIKQAAEAVHEAHRMGLIHRDLKPANIMIEEQKDGELKPFVLDFGIARELEDPHLTATGMVVGSPYYMSPEQARGDYHKLDRRTDIYALGVMLYFLLSHQVPFTGDTPVEILIKVVRDEPVKLNRVEPSVPADLNTIVMKCLEKEPTRRYDSARALAEDLQRYLDDEPIEAKKSGLVYRIQKKIRKNKALSAVIFIAFIAILFLAAWGLNIHMQSRERAALAQRFGQKIKEIETMMRFAFMLPLHNTGNEKKIVRLKMKEIEDEMRQVGSAAEAPGLYALGRGFLSLRDFESARLYLEKAWTNNYREPEAAYALGQVLGAIYQRALEEVEGIKDENLRRERMREIVKKYRLPALHYLRLSRGVKLGTPVYIEALIAFYEERYQRALEYTRRAGKETPWLYEAYKLEGDIYAILAKSKRRLGEIKETLSYYEQAEKAFHKAISIARSDSLNYGGLAALRAGMLTLSVRMGQSPDPVMKKLLTACDQAVTADPGNADAYNIKSFGYSFKGYFLSTKGENPLPALQKAIEAASYSLKIKPGYYDAWNNLGMAYQIKGDYELIHGLNPGESLKQAIHCLSKAIGLKPGIDYPYNNLGITYWSLAQHQKELGRNPLPALNNAISSFRKALSLVPGYPVNLHNLSGVQVIKGEYELEQGMDPSNSLAAAAENAEKAIKVNPEYPAFYVPLLRAHLILAEYKILTGIDPGDSLKRTAEILKKAQKIDNTNIELIMLEAKSYFLQGWFYLLQGKSPSAHRFFDRAETILRSVIKGKSGLIEASMLQAEMELLLGKWQVSKGKSPVTHIKNAFSALRKVEKSKKGYMESYVLLADAYQLEAAWRTITKSSSGIGGSIDKSLSYLDRIFEIDAEAAEALLIKGILILLKAKNTASRDQKEKLAAQAEAFITRALEMNGLLKRKYNSYLSKIKKEIR